MLYTVLLPTVVVACEESYSFLNAFGIFFHMKHILHVILFQLFLINFVGESEKNPRLEVLIHHEKEGLHFLSNVCRRFLFLA